MQAGNGPTFSTVEDSPMFRSTVSDLEETLDRLENRCNRFVKGSKKYKEGVNTLSHSQLSFADFLEEFCGGPDEESMMLGGGTMSKFVSVFRELASFSELLHTQVELILVERLHRNWLKGVLADGRDSKRQLDRRVAEYDAARLKHLGHKANPRPSKWRKADDSEKIHNDMVHAQSSAEEARFECARKLTELESRKRYEFLEAMVSSMDAHLRFFERGHELLKNLDPYIQQGLQKVQELKAEQEQGRQGLDAMIFNYREEKSARGARAADAADKVPLRTGGPMQLTSGMSASIASIEGYIRESEDTHGGVITVLKQGYLLKRSSNIRKEWKRRFFVLDSLGMLYYYSNKERVNDRKTPQNTVKLLTSTIKAGAEEEGLRYCFRVVSPEKTYLLQAEDELDQQEWMEAIQGVTACLLNGDVDIEALSRAQPKPTRPTHSRQGSRAGSISSLEDISFSPMGGAMTPQGSDLASFTNGMPLELEPARSSTEEQPVTPHAVASPSGRRHTTLGPSPLSAKGPRGGHAHSSSLGAPTGAPPGSPLGGPLGGSQKALASTPRQRHTVAGVLTPQGSSKLFARAASPNSPLDILRRVPGNAFCCDCGAAEPDWASLNLGTLLCIECSGIHRRLGVHVSKVRSLTLDVKVWDEAVLTMMEGLGNEAANEHWEAELLAESAKADSWVWCDDDGDAPESAFDLAGQARSGVNSPQGNFSFSRSRPPEGQGQNLPPLSPRGTWDNIRAGQHGTPLAQPSSARADTSSSAKPKPTDSLAAKEQFITAKYVERMYISLPHTFPGATAQTGLWEAVESGNLREVARAVAGGAEINTACSGRPAVDLIRDSNALAGGANLEPTTSTANLTALHFACRSGDVGLVEFLLQNGARWDKADPYGRAPLHYCVLYEHPILAKQLLKRGADNTVQDVLGRTALDLAVGKGRLPDNELFVMLAPPESASPRLL